MAGTYHSLSILQFEDTRAGSALAIANKAAVDMHGKTCTAACLNSSGINAQGAQT